MAKTTLVIYRTESSRINGQLNHVPKDNLARTRDVEKFAKSHNVTKIYNEQDKIFEEYKK